MKRLLAIVMAFLFPAALLPGALGDVSIGLGIACYAAWRTRRWDVLYKFPIYYWLSLVNYCVFMRAMLEILVFRKELMAWNKVKRYEFDSQT